MPVVKLGPGILFGEAIGEDYMVPLNGAKKEALKIPWKAKRYLVMEQIRETGLHYPLGD